MSTRILPQEFHFEETASNVRVKTVVEKELIDAVMLIAHCRHYRLDAGTTITVQVMSKHYDVLYHEAVFKIERAVETQRQVIDERGERTARVIDYAVVQDSPWKSYSEAPAEEKPEIAALRIDETYVLADASLKWNLGKKAYLVIVDGKVEATVDRLEGESKEDYKTRALAIAAGSQPLPRAA